MIAETIIASVVAGTSVCSDHFNNPMRFNPNEISDYQECIVEVFHADKKSGVMGSLFWARLPNGEIISMPVKVVAEDDNAFKKKAREAMLEDVIDDLNDRLDDIIDERDDLNDEFELYKKILEKRVIAYPEAKGLNIDNADSLIDVITDIIDRIEKDAYDQGGTDYHADLVPGHRELAAAATQLNAVLQVLDPDYDPGVYAIDQPKAIAVYAKTALNKAYVEIGNMQLLLEAKDIQIQGLEDYIDVLNGNIEDLEEKLRDKELELANKIREFKDYKQAIQDAATTPDFIPEFDVPNIAGAGQYAVSPGFVGNHIVAQGSAGVINKDLNFIDVGNDRYHVLGEEVSVFIDYDKAATNGPWVANGKGYSSLDDLFAGEGLSSDVALGQVWGVNGEIAKFNKLEYNWKEVTQIAIDAYNDGYDDGYADGYEDGYRDGFADGVDSVKSIN